MNVCVHCGLKHPPSSTGCGSAAVPEADAAIETSRAELARRARRYFCIAGVVGLLGLGLLGIGFGFGFGKGAVLISALVIGIGAMFGALGLRIRAKQRQPVATHHLEWCDGIRTYAPLSTLKPISEGIWWVDGPVIKMSLGPISLPFPTRMVIIRLRSGGLWIWSPTAPTPELFAEIDALGRVEHLVSPNKVHYAAIPAWKERYPHATAWASPRVRERASSQKIEVAFDADLDDDAPSPWAGDIEQLVFRGSRFMEEVVFFHTASSTLILADLVIALERERVRPPLRWLLALVGALWPGQTPRELQLTFWGRKPQARTCYQRMLGWQPRRVIFAHGRLYLEDAAAQLERAFAWLR